MARFKHTDKALFRGEEVEIKQVKTNHSNRTVKYVLTTGEEVEDKDLNPLSKEVKKVKKERQKKKVIQPVEKEEFTSDNQEDTKH
jgi:hypothetical protein